MCDGVVQVGDNTTTPPPVNYCVVVAAVVAVDVIVVVFLVFTDISYFFLHSPHVLIVAHLPYSWSRRTNVVWLQDDPQQGTEG